jgi:hypothetical protein
VNLYHDFTPTNVRHYTVSDQNQMSPVYLFIQIQILIGCQPLNDKEFDFKKELKLQFLNLHTKTLEKK